MIPKKKRGRRTNAAAFNGAPMGAEYTFTAGNQFLDALARKFLQPGTEQYRILRHYRDAYRAAGGAFDADGRHKPGSAAAGAATAATVAKFPGRASSPKNRARAIEKLVGNGERALAFVSDWQKLHAEKFQQTHNEAVVRLRLAKAVMAARPAPVRRTDAGAVTGETAARMRKAPLLSDAEAAFLNQAGAFEEGAPAALASALAGALLDATDELQAAEARAKAAETRSQQAEARLEKIERYLETADPAQSFIGAKKAIKKIIAQ